MSAWIVSKAHVDAIVTAMVDLNIIDLGDAGEVGTTLWTENHRSVNVRYGESTEVPAYTYEWPDFDVDFAKIHSLVGCYQYQCAEWDRYDQEPGYLLTERLREAIVAHLGFDPDEREISGPWGITSLDEVAAS